MTTRLPFSRTARSEYANFPYWTRGNCVTRVTRMSQKLIQLKVSFSYKTKSCKEISTWSDLKKMTFESSCGAGTQSVTVKSICSGFDSHLRTWNSYLNVFFQFLALASSFATQRNAFRMRRKLGDGVSNTSGMQREADLCILFIITFDMIIIPNYII